MPSTFLHATPRLPQRSRIFAPIIIHIRFHLYFNCYRILLTTHVIIYYTSNVAIDTKVGLPLLKVLVWSLLPPNL